MSLDKLFYNDLELSLRIIKIIKEEKWQQINQNQNQSQSQSQKQKQNQRVEYLLVLK